MDPKSRTKPKPWNSSMRAHRMSKFFFILFLLRAFVICFEIKTRWKRSFTSSRCPHNGYHCGKVQIFDIFLLLFEFQNENENLSIVILNHRRLAFSSFHLRKTNIYSEKENDLSAFLALVLSICWWRTSFFRPIFTDQFVAPFPCLFLTIGRTVPGIAASTASRKRLAIGHMSIGQNRRTAIDHGWQRFTFGARIRIVTFETASLTFTPEVIGAFEHRSTGTTGQGQIHVVNRQFFAWVQLMFASNLSDEKRREKSCRERVILWFQLLLASLDNP